MSKSKKTKKHFMDGDQLETMRGIRKPMPPATKIINPKDINKNRHWNWRDSLNDTEDLDELDDINDTNDIV